MINLKRLFIALCLFTVCLSGLYAEVNVTGTVVDAKGEPLIGVSVVVKGTAKGTITDLNGKYEISAPSPGSFLVFSYIGFDKNQVLIGDRKNIPVTLEENAKSLDEVVVIGYGEMKRRDLTGAVGKADVGEMLKSTGASVAEALAGRVAGVQVSQSEGMPGGEMNIVVRGTNSITGSNAPLYVVDGFPLEEGANISAINKNDIENMEILKDASSTAIYGARGANGVIIITTKQGTAGAPSISYNGSFGVQQVTRTVPLMDAYEFVKLQAEKNPASMASTYYSTYNGKTWTLEDYKNIKQYDWQNEVLKQAQTVNHSLSITGGTDAARYVASLSYFDQAGIVINTGFNRIQGRLGNTIKRDKLTINVNLDYSTATQKGSLPSSSSYSSSNNLFYSVWGYRPVTTPGVPLESLADNLVDDAVSGLDYRVNPIISQKNQASYTTTNILKASGYLEYEFFKGLKLKSSIGYTENNRIGENFNNSSTVKGGPYSVDKVNSSYTENKITTWLNENTLNYNKTFNSSHNFAALLGYTMQGSTSLNTNMYASQMTIESLGMNGMSFGTPTTTSYNIPTPWTMMSFLSRANYNYKSKYYITASFRADGSSKFTGKNKFGYFPSGSLAWNFTEEEFMQPIKDLFSSGKLRLGWGVTGNNRVNENASYQQMAQNNSNSYGLYPFNGVLTSNGPVPTSIANPNLRWESTTQWNLGTDVSFFDQRLALTVDVYQKNTIDLLLDAKIPMSVGQTSGMQNIGETSNKGIEFSVTTRNVKTKSFKWTTNFNIAFNKNSVVMLANGQNSMAVYASSNDNMPSYIAQVGQPLGLMYGYVYDGTYKYSDFNVVGGKYVVKPGVAVLTTENSLQPGFPKYRDLNRDGKVDVNDQTIIGSGVPIHLGGISNEFSYKGIDLTIFFQWSVGNQILNANRYHFENPMTTLAPINQYASYINRWSPTNPNSDIPSALTSLASNQLFSSRVIEDGSFLRFKNITLGYSLASKLCHKLKLQKVRFFASANDIWVLTNYSGFDPEVSVRNQTLSPGVDFSAYPKAMSINGGINLTF